MQKLYRSAVANSRLQAQDHEQDIEEILRRYVEINQTYLEDRALIPADRLIEIKFEDLVSNKLAVIAQIYEAINLSGFNEIESSLRGYIEVLDKYETSKYEPLQEELQETIMNSWGFCFDAWNYSTT
jgi:hypothetical protein